MLGWRTRRFGRSPTKPISLLKADTRLYAAGNAHVSMPVWERGFRLTFSFSERHVCRGPQPSKTDFIMGHEATGEIVELGPEVKSPKKGDRVVMPFTASCGE